jgi:hypothetical protein
MSYGIYLLTDMRFKVSYCGFSGSKTNSSGKNCISERYRKHALKLKASAKCTKRFDGCVLIAKIEGFPTKHSALSMEWWAKTGRKVGIRKERLLLPHAPHRRLENFLAPLKLAKFLKIKQNLTIYVNDPNKIWSSNISEFYKVNVEQLTPPFLLEHVKPKQSEVEKSNKF